MHVFKIYLHGGWQVCYLPVRYILAGVLPTCEVYTGRCLTYLRGIWNVYGDHNFIWFQRSTSVTKEEFIIHLNCSQSPIYKERLIHLRIPMPFTLLLVLHTDTACEKIFEHVKPHK